MDNTFQRLCQLYLSEEKLTRNKEYKKLVKQVSPETLNKVEQLEKKLKKEAKKIGYATDYKSYSLMIENYISQKGTLTEKEKVQYLKLLITLSKIYNIDLRDELNKYNIVAKNDNKKELFYQFCRLILDDDYQGINELKKTHEKQETLYKKALAFIEYIKDKIKHLDLDINSNYFDEILNIYLAKKANLNDEEKTEYLKILLYLSEIYQVNLKKMFLKQKEKSVESSFSNIIENEELLKAMIEQRRDNGYFDIKSLYIKSDILPVLSHNYDDLKLQADLLHRLLNIFVNKMVNGLYTDLNSEYTKLVGEEELKILKDLDREKIYELLKLIREKEPVNYLVRKFKLTNNIYELITKAVSETLDFDQLKIGTKTNNMFDVSEKTNDITIYISGAILEINLLINEYIRECVLNKVNYELRLEQTDLTNNLYLFANSSDLRIKISILETVKEKYENIIKMLTTPLKISCSIDNSYYGLTKRYVYKKQDELSYIDYFNYLTEVAYYSILAKKVLSNIKDETEEKVIKGFINLDNIEYNEQEAANPILAKYNGTAFENIKDIINKYLPSINNWGDNDMNELLREFKNSLCCLNDKWCEEDAIAHSNLALNSDIANTLLAIKNNCSEKE